MVAIVLLAWPFAVFLFTNFSVYCELYEPSELI